MTIASHTAVVSIATGASASFSVSDGIKSFDLSDGTDLLDATDFASGRLRQRIAGLRDMSGSLSGDLELADVAYLKIKAGYAAGEPTYVQIQVDGTNGMTVPVLFESIDRSGEVGSQVEISMSWSLEGSTDPSDVAAGM